MFTNLMPVPKQQYFNSVGLPLVGGKIYTYAAGTSTPKSTYSDAAGNVAQTNPITLNVRGEPDSAIYWRGAYRVEVRDILNNLIYSVDDYETPVNVNELASVSGAGLVGYDSAQAYTAGTVGAALKSFLSSTGASLIGWIQSGTGAVLRTLESKNRDFVNLKDFNGKIDGSTDDTAAWQAAINYISLPSSPKRLIIPQGATGVTKLTAPITINTGGITIEWENNTVTAKKFFNGDMFIVRAGMVAFINPGMDGNGVAGYTGGGIRFGPASQFTFDCVVQNPRIKNTLDSCLIFEGPRGGSGILVSGGTLLPYNGSGASSGGYPGARVTGPTDADVSNRQFIGVTSSSQPLIDVTGMWVTKISNCFTGTILFKGNPDVTGVGAAYASCSEIFIDNTYIRDGLTISGLEVMIDNCLSHGFAPVYAGAYGAAPTGSATYGWAMTSDTIACRMGPANIVSNGITDNSPNGHAIENQCSSFGYGKVMVTDWTGATVNPVLGNGTVLSTYDIDYKTINFRVNLLTGSTTTRGAGKWSFALPLWVSLYAPPVGLWLLIRPGFPNMSGPVLLTASGSTHRISLSDVNSASSYIDDVYPASLPTGSQFYIDFSYSRG